MFNNANGTTLTDLPSLTTPKNSIANSARIGASSLQRNNQMMMQQTSKSGEKPRIGKGGKKDLL